MMATFDALKIYWKRDATFKPLKDKATVRVYVSLGGAVVELLVTGPKWYDTWAEQDGSGTIDLAVYLLRLDFASVVKRLRAIPAQPSAIA